MRHGRALLSRAMKPELHQPASGSSVLKLTARAEAAALIPRAAVEGAVLS